MSQQSMKFTSAKDVAEFVKREYKLTGRGLSLAPGFKNEVGEHFRLIDQNTGTTFHIKYAQEHFKKFGQFFPEFGKGEGESISTKVMAQLKDNDVIFFGGKDGILMIFAGDVREKGVCRDNEKYADSTWSVGIEHCLQFP